MLTRFSAINMNGQDARSTVDKFSVRGTGRKACCKFPKVDKLSVRGTGILPVAKKSI